jgi:hypothetical protein
MESLILETKLSRQWSLWYHQDKDNWKITGFKNIYTMETINDFWQLYNNWDKLGSINQKHYFLMQKEITPIWEDENNRKGGCWSFKVHENQAQELWDDLSIYLVTEKLSSKQNDITGLSICLKKNNYSVVKIWNRNSKENSLALLNEAILKKWGMDIIYIAHIPE